MPGPAGGKSNNSSIFVPGTNPELSVTPETKTQPQTAYRVRGMDWPAKYASTAEVNWSNAG
jgi:hypothetical protein